MSGPTELLDFLVNQIADVDTGWSIGTFGAIAEFTRDVDEAPMLTRSDNAISLVTPRGGLRIEACHELRPIASQSPTTESWTHRVALCLPEQACAVSGRTVLAEVGPDHDAMRAEDREAVPSDLSLGTLQVDACVRGGDRNFVERLRPFVGKSVFAPDNGQWALF